MTQSMSKQHALIMNSTSGRHIDGGADGPDANDSKRGGRETIHSGQFMVSSFETEAKEDDDEKITIPDDPYEPINKEIETLHNSIISTGIQKYTPKHTNMNNTQVMIETSLSKLFNCMQLTYKQKLTSPKWNHFKGIRLSWKDKIRLNNLIWRCWHSQFMKKKNSMCQFASPIDLDLQIKPEAIVLEGKYWKRDHRVICAEYRKWRKYYIKNSHEIQNSIDTVREFTRSKENDTDAFLDLIFSSYSNDSRDLAGVSVRADFIQPSLETLQPTIDDIFDSDYLFLKSDYGMQEPLDFFSFSRLPPVPEEGSGDDIYNKPIEYRSIPSIMNSEQLNQTTANITEIANQQNNQVPTIQQTSSSNNLNQQESTMEPVHYQAKMLAHTINYGQQYNNDFNNQIEMVIDSYPSDDNQDQTMNQTSQSVDIGAKNFQKGRISKINYKGFSRREPHNYDKILPTVSQTLIYNQIMAQTQQSQQQQQQQYNNNSTYQDSSSILSALHHNSPIQTTTNNFSLQNIPAQNVLNLSSNQQQQQQQQSANRYLNQSLQNINILPAQSQSQQANLMQNVQNLIPMLSINAQHSPPSIQTQNDSQQQQQQQQPPLQQQDSYKAVSSHTINSSNEAYKPYHNPHTYKMNSQSGGLGGYTTSLPTRGHMRHKSPPGTDQNLPQSTSQQAKEMYRSHSLPMNAKLQLPPKEEQFAVPNYKIKAAKQSTRSRSNSMVIKHQAILPALQSASSEPMLNTSNSALLQQLLSSSGSTTSSNSSNSSTIMNKSISSPPLIPQNMFAQNQSQQVQPQQSTSPLSYGNINSPGSSSGNQSIMVGNYTSNQSPPMTTTPVLSPEMLTDSKMSSSSNFDTNPLSPSKSGNSSNGSRYPRENRRAGHIHAEQKRRYNIKNGFDTLHSLIPQLQQNPNAKLSKAAMLQKGAEYIKQLRNERTLNNEQMETLKRERDNLNNSLNHLHSVLPANGAPISRQRTGRVKEMYTEYIHQRTLQNWKFWIFGLIFEPLLHSFNSTVSVASIDELYRTAKLWVDQNCSLVELRPAVSNKLRYLSTTTDILSDPPSTLHEEVMKAIALRNSQQTQQPQQPQ